jgi:hypothetical protein
MSKGLTDQELLDLLMRDDDSVIGGLSDDEDVGWDNEYVAATESRSQETIEEPEENVESNENILQQEAESNVDNNTASTSVQNPEAMKQQLTLFYQTNNLTEKQNIFWRKDVHYEARRVEWHVPEIEEFSDLPKPIQFFENYIPESIFQQITNMTHLYATQKNLARFPPATIEEIKKVFAIDILMGNLKFPRSRLDWNSTLGISIIKHNMSFNRFSKLRNALHLVDITQRPDNNNDRLWKVRDLYNSILGRCHELPLETDLCVDEQMVPFKGQINIKQYIKNKPKKWGIKIFILAGKSGLVYDFLIYQGASTEIKKIYQAFGSGAATVMQLVERLKANQTGRYALYFDNYFSTYNLFQYLESKGIMAIGTLRINRFQNPPLKSDKQMKREGRGSCDSTVSNDGIVITKWYDNKTVLVGSNFVGIGNVDNCNRWDKVGKTYIDVPRPEVIYLYNKNMGGVDKLDFLLSLYRSYHRSKKWTVRMIAHATDLGLANSWLEYVKRARELSVPKKIF